MKGICYQCGDSLEGLAYAKVRWWEEAIGKKGKIIKTVYICESCHGNEVDTWEDVISCTYFDEEDAILGATMKGECTKKQ